MTAFTRSRVGPPEGGRYLVGDVVTDSVNTEWKCVRGGMADGGMFPNSGHAQFVAMPNGYQAAPTAKTTSATLTVAELLSGIITANQGAAGAATYTMPLNTSLDTALPNMQVDESFDFAITNISTNATEDVTVAGNTGVTAVGNMTVASNAAVGDQATGIFRVRKTAANAYSVYRIAS